MWSRDDAVACSVQIVFKSPRFRGCDAARRNGGDLLCANRCAVPFLASTKRKPRILKTHTVGTLLCFPYRTMPWAPCPA